MAIEPEIIPKGSSEGESASEVFPKWIEYTVILIFILILGLILKLFYTLILMGLGAAFIWKLAVSKLNQ